MMMLQNIDYVGSHHECAHAFAKHSEVLWLKT